MIKTVIGVLLVVGVIVAISMGMKDAGTTSQAASLDPDLKESRAAREALEEIKKEKKVLRAFIDSGVLYAELEDDGTRRDGYASYLCEIVREHKAQVTKVRVIEHNTKHLLEADTSHGVLLGQTSCK